MQKNVFRSLCFISNNVMEKMSHLAHNSAHCALGAFLRTTKIQHYAEKLVISVNAFLKEIQLSHEGMSERSEQCERTSVLNDRVTR